MEYIEINVDRLLHVMAQYKVSKEDLLSILNSERKILLTEKDVFRNYVKLSTLKKIDKIFKKGIVYYIDPEKPTNSNDESIFFRKNTFNAELSLGAKQKINEFEQEKLSLSGLSKLVDLNTNRKLPFYNIDNKAESVAIEVREYLYPSFERNSKDFLKKLIAKFAEYNIIVFEFVEPSNRKDKANIEGMFLRPNFIVLKRVKPFKREIFTLMHELGHYLLDIEEIDGNVTNVGKNHNSLSHIERWCNDFAFYFLAGNYSKEIEAFEQASDQNDYNFDAINNISQITHLSVTAIYTNLLLKNKISAYNYKKTIDSIQADFTKKEQEKRKRLDLEKEQAKLAGKEIRGSQPKPIISPLYLDTLQTALFSGLITEGDFCKRLNITPKKLDKYIA